MDAGLLILIAGAAVALILLLRQPEKQFDPVKDILGKASETLQDVVSGAGDVAKEIGSGIKSVGSGIKTVGSDLYGGAKSVVKDTYGGAKSVVKDVYSAPKTAVKGFAGALGGAGDAVSDIFGSIF